MDNALYYLAVNRQVGLRREMDVIANNVANLDTSGFRREGMLFSEVVHAGRAGPSLSMADAGVRYASSRAGPTSLTGAALDVAVEGEGFFAVEDAEGVVLTRAGRFQVSEAGLVVTPEGRTVLDDGGAPIFLPPGAGAIEIAADGTVSADGQPQARLGVYVAAPETLVREGRAGFRPEAGFEPAIAPRVRQGALEGANVEPVAEIARMIQVSRAYEQVQGLIRDEDERIRDAIRTLGEPV